MKLKDFMPWCAHGECDVIISGPDHINWLHPDKQQQLSLVYNPPDQIPWTTTGVWFPRHVVLVVREAAL